MRRLGLSVLISVGLCATGSAWDGTLTVTDLSLSNPPYHHVWVGQNVKIQWLYAGKVPILPLTIELRRYGVLVRVLATDVPVTSSGKPPGAGQATGSWVWSGGPKGKDIGCGYTILVTGPAVAGGWSKGFGIFEVPMYKDTYGNTSPVRVDAPSSAFLVRNQVVDIAWSMIAEKSYYPSQAVKFELYVQNQRIGEIVDFGENFNDPGECHMQAGFKWRVGYVKDFTNPPAQIGPDIPGAPPLAKPGSGYQIRASTGTGVYFTKMFAIVAEPPTAKPPLLLTPIPVTVKH